MEQPSYYQPDARSQSILTNPMQLGALAQAFSNYPHVRDIMRQASGSTRNQYYTREMEIQNCMLAPSIQELRTYLDDMPFQTDQKVFNSIAVFTLETAPYHTKLLSTLYQAPTYGHKTADYIVYHSYIRYHQEDNSLVFELKHSTYVNNNFVFNPTIVLSLDPEWGDVYSRDEQIVGNGKRSYFTDVLTEYMILINRDSCRQLVPPDITGSLSYAKWKTIKDFQDTVTYLRSPELYATIHHLINYLHVNCIILDISFPDELIGTVERKVSKFISGDLEYTQQQVKKQMEEILNWVQQYADRVQPQIEQAIQDIIDAILALPE